MGKPAKGEFTPKNPQKLMRKGKPIIYRSGWELQFMHYLDQHPWVIGWGSETVSIPYFNPLAKRWSYYWPDFIVAYQNPKTGAQWAEMIEVKPAKEDPVFEGKVDRRTRLVQEINAAKWAAAKMWCAKNRINFRVMTEREMFGAKR